MTDHLITPHGGELLDLIVVPDRADELRGASLDWPSWDLTPRQISDLELLLNGAFSPLAGFMTPRDYEPVCEQMRLADGTLWPIPITLDITEDAAEALESGATLALRDPEGIMLAGPPRRRHLATGPRPGRRSCIRDHQSRASRGRAPPG